MNAKEYFRYWPQVRQGLYDALGKLGGAQLGFVPREGLWSLGTVACHVAEAEDGWFRYAISRELEKWPSFSPADYPTVAAVKALLAEVHARTEAYLETVDAQEMDRAIEVPWGEKLSLHWCIWHVLEHEVHHRGEIYLMLGLMGLEAPDL